MNIDVPTLSLIVGTVIPLLVGVVTKEVASSAVKGVLNALLSSIAGALTVVIAANGEWVINDIVHGALATFIASIATYYGLWKPTGISASVNANTPGFIGRDREERIADDVPIMLADE